MKYQRISLERFQYALLSMFILFFKLAHAEPLDPFHKQITIPKNSKSSFWKEIEDGYRFSQETSNPSQKAQAPSHSELQLLIDIQEDLIIKLHVAEWNLHYLLGDKDGSVYFPMAHFNFKDYDCKIAFKNYPNKLMRKLVPICESQ